jgi:GNAT superfamily N-acetyltransferase
MGKSSKQQDRAKNSSRINRLNREMLDIKSGFTALTNRLHDRVSFREIDNQQVAPLWQKWADDYRADGGSVQSGSPSTFLNDGARQAWAIVVDGQDLGLLVTYQPYDNLDQLRTVEIIWVDPAVRGQGIATYAYLYAQHHFDAKGVELQLRRARKAAYWRAMNFSYFTIFNNQRGVNNSLCILLTPEGREIFGICPQLSPWDIDTVKTYMRKKEAAFQQQKILEALLSELGKCSTRAERCSLLASAVPILA